VRRDVGSELSGVDCEAAFMDAYARVATPSRHASVREELAPVEAAMESLAEVEGAVIVLARIVGLSRAQIDRWKWPLRSQRSALDGGEVDLRWHAGHRSRHRWGFEVIATLQIRRQGPRHTDVI